MTPGAISYGLVAALAIALLVAAATDLRSRRIDNRLNAAVAGGAPLFWLASGLSAWPGVAFQLGCAGIMLLLLAGVFEMGLMGGGDVKLLTGLALWLPWRPFLELIVLMALVGGLLTLLLAAWHLLRRRRERLQIPYGVAIACAGLWVLGTHYGLAAADNEVNPILTDWSDAVRAAPARGRG